MLFISVWNGLLKPSDVTSGSGKKVWWQCRVNKDHAWLAVIYSRKSGNGCAICAGAQVNSTNSLAALAPEIAKEWDSSKNGNLSPDKVTISSNRKVWWKCPSIQIIVGTHKLIRTREKKGAHFARA